MRKFSSYGPVDVDSEFYVPRKQLIDQACQYLTGIDWNKGGSYFTVWGPRQVGKSWVMQQAFFQLDQEKSFDAVKINLEYLKRQTDVVLVVQALHQAIGEKLGKDWKKIGQIQGDPLEQLQQSFSQKYLDRPLLLVLDEFDALCEDAISALVGVFRNIYLNRKDDRQTFDQKQYLLHGIALIGVRKVLGVENDQGSPFNIQRNLHIPNLTSEEVASMFLWYERESKQKVDSEVVCELFYETKGQPGLTSWFGELLTDEYNESPQRPITLDQFQYVFELATYALPNNNILNIVSKAKKDPYRKLLMEIFRTDKKHPFAYDDPALNYLYMHGIIDMEKSKDGFYAKFSSPFIQKRLFNLFSRETFQETGHLHDPFENLQDSITNTEINVKNLIKHYQKYLQKNKDWLFQEVPRRSDLRIYEAVFHFNLYQFLTDFLQDYQGKVVPEFPTGNGQIDLMIRYAGKLYGLELKSYRNFPSYQKALTQASFYGKQLGLPVIFLILFVESIDEENRKKLEVDFIDSTTGVHVSPIFVVIGASL